jgi:RNA polymerase sigma-70 factor, ECF subfamily
MVPTCNAGVLERPVQVVADTMTEHDETEHAGAVRVRAVYELDHARLWRSVYGFSRSPHIADESVAEAFAQALRRGDEIKDVRAWVWRSAFAIARGELQRQGAESGSRRDELGVELQPAGLVAILGALADLSEPDRELIVLCHIGGWTPSELAPLLDASPAALRVRLHRATRRARALLGQEENR